MRLKRIFPLICAAALFVLGLASTASAAGAADPGACAQCHTAESGGWTHTAHAKANVTCLSCHKAGDPHQKPAGAANELYDPAVCAPCHDTEYQEWRRSGHNQPVPYTKDEILPELITDCVRCHNVAGYLEVTRSGKPFEKMKGQVADATSPGVTCVACHDVHSGSSSDMLRAADRATVCDNCHGGKWQHLVLNGTGGQRYADRNYDKSSVSPHNTGDRCVMCHMAKTDGVAAGGHTLRMRDDQGALNLSGCRPCHQNLRDFNVGGKQTETKAMLESLAAELKERNAGELPRNQPGKCNECHRGGTEPFKQDPDGVLEQAYQNYRLFLFDRSLGVHNPAYTRQMLQDSITHVLQGYSGAPLPQGAEGCCGHQG
ncbi:MAG: cytochrome c3 family protein [Chitinophagales bacterium]